MFGMYKDKKLTNFRNESPQTVPNDDSQNEGIVRPKTASYIKVSFVKKTTSNLPSFAMN